MFPIDVSIILLNYNSIAFTEQCIGSIVTNTHINYEIIIVENGSNDRDRIGELENKFPNTRIIFSKVNLGFGGGNNLGAEAASGKYITILNNDTVVFPGTIDKVKELLDKSDNKTVVTGFIEDNDGALQFSGGKEPKILAELLRFGILLIKYFPNKYYEKYYFFPEANAAVRTLDWASGCFFAISTNFYKNLGGFDEKMFMYVEDVEFHKRVRLAGGVIKFQPELKVKHFGSQTSKNYKDEILKSHYKNTVYYFHKHSSKLSLGVFFFISKLIFLLWFLIFSILEKLFLTKRTKFMEKKIIYKILLFA